jgi:hypothetical protein
MADRQTIVQISQVVNPAQTSASSTTIMASNNTRVAFMIQNLDNSNPLKICFGGTASSTVYHLILKAASGSGVGDGGTVAMEGPVTFTGAITCYSAGTPAYTYLEI